MQTSKWGPDGWRLMHSIANNYSGSDQNPAQQDLYWHFYQSLASILPCIYCQVSYQQFIQEIPFSRYCHSNEAMRYYVYLIHNRVNDKLRSQGFPKPPNPAFRDIWKGIHCGWDFLFAVVYNYPENPDHKSRRDYLTFFWLLRELLPCLKIRAKYQRYYDATRHERPFQCRQSLCRWLSRFYQQVNPEIRDQAQIDAKYEAFRASCSGSKTVGTCSMPLKIEAKTNHA